MGAIMNVVTGVFVESTMASAKDEQDYFMVSNVRELFAATSGGMSGSLTWVDFESLLDRSQMQAYFKAIDVDISEAKGVFQLLDLDKSGSIDAEEFLSGCLRLRGPAKALDLALLMHEVQRVNKGLKKIRETLALEVRG